MIIRDAVFVYQMKEIDEIKWHGRSHEHGENCYEIHYFLGGEGTFLNGNTISSITPGSLFFTAPAHLHAIKAQDTNHPITYYAVLLETGEDDTRIRVLLDEELQRTDCYHIGTNNRFFFEELRERSMSGIPNLQLSAVHQLISFLYLLSAEGENSYSSSDNVHLEKAIQFMQNNVMNSITLPDIAAHLHLNESYFIRLFKKRIHTTPMKYYTRLKIEAAGALLAETTMSVKEISARLHFYSEFHFSRTFKAYTGLAPSTYRRTYLQQLGVSAEMRTSSRLKS